MPDRHGAGGGARMAGRLEARPIRPDDRRAAGGDIMRVWATARYEDGELRLSVLGAEDYLGRSATVALDVTDGAELAAIRQAFDAILAREAVRLGQHAELAAAKAMVAADNLGEVS